MCEAYRQLVRNPSAIFNQINPNGTNNPAICPETADALGDFLRSNRIRPIRTRSNSADFYITTRGQWLPVAYDRIGRGLAECSHDIIESTRHDNARYPNHYFVVFRVDNATYVADAFTHDLHRTMDAYSRAANLDPADMRNRELWTFRRMAGVRFDVRVNDPLEGFERPGTDPIEGINAGM